VGALVEPAGRFSSGRAFLVDDDTMTAILAHPKVPGPVFERRVVDLHGRVLGAAHRERVAEVVKDRVRTGCTHASTLVLSGHVKVDEHTRDDAFMNLASMKFDAHHPNHICAVAGVVARAPYSREAKDAFMDAWENHLSYTKDSNSGYHSQCERALSKARETVRNGDREDGGRLTAISR